MSKSFTYYHNPRCSKSCQGLALLEEKGVNFQVREYLKDPLGAGELQELFAKLPDGIERAIRIKEATYKELGLKDKDLSLEELCGVVAENPILLERPILADAKKAAIGRPPEDLLKIL